MITSDNFRDYRESRQFKGEVFEGIAIDWWEVKRGEFEDCIFRNCSFGGEVSLINCKFRNTSFNNCKFNGSSMEDSTFILCKFNDCSIAYNNSFSSCIFFDVSFNHCDVIKNNFSRASFNSTKFNMGKFYYNDITSVISKGLTHYLENTDVKM